ncbi:unnamed protein product [Fusarium graminearum]|uniref:Uncharacterized protein n=1 Tax=Gibberella zeae TaxID=5518 RepID=A0A4E9D1L2_GIBZA|nr:unnamed protein product [Fusarium graminearum]CAG1982866.1 unnamed protein product [Fusarium graminearum]CAG2004678.1 unnamed protein product [Fusarium graminearum]
MVDRPTTLPPKVPYLNLNQQPDLDLFQSILGEKVHSGDEEKPKRMVGSFVTENSTAPFVVHPDRAWYRMTHMIFYNILIY